MPIGWITVLSIAAIAAVDLAGIWGIAVARRGTMEEADRLFRLETMARATSVESVLSATRADLAFLAGSPVFLRLESGLDSRDPREARWRRLAAEGAMLLFLRGHPEVARLAARSSSGAVLVAAGRRGGVPVLWQSRPLPGRGEGEHGPSVAQTIGPAVAQTIGPVVAQAIGPAAATPSPETRAVSASAGAHGPGEHAGDAVTARVAMPVSGVFAVAPATPEGDDAARLEASLDVTVLLPVRLASGAPLACALSDAEGTLLAGERYRGRASASSLAAAVVEEDPEPVIAADAADRATATADRSRLVAESAVHTGGWTAPSPWRLTCERRDVPALALVEPLASRYRLTLALNLVIMALGLLLGCFAILQTRRRHLLEATAREEARVRALERRLFHAERLGTVGRLAAGIAHEINNPLEGMSNYLRLAREDLERGDPASARRRLEGVREGLDRAAGIVRQVLTYAEPAPATNARTDLNEVLAQSLDFVRSRTEFGRIAFFLEPAEERLHVDGSPIMLGQVFLNLLLNACEAQPEGGEVRVRSARVGGEAIAEIADRGPGVPALDRERVLEPFYSTKRSTGLGLYIVDSIVRQHGGELLVHDQDGGGARFVVRLPSSEASGSAAVANGACPAGEGRAGRQRHGEKGPPGAAPVRRHEGDAPLIDAAGPATRATLGPRGAGKSSPSDREPRVSSPRRAPASVARRSVARIVADLQVWSARLSGGTDGVSEQQRAGPRDSKDVRSNREQPGKSGGALFGARR